MSSETVSVYLLKETIDTPDQAVSEDARVSSTHAIVAGETTGTLFVSESAEHEPEWVRLLAPAATPDLSGAQLSTSAVLVLPASDRWFAITFGFRGRYMLDRQLYEYDFGLKVALNGLNPEGLRGASARTFNDYALQTNRQLSRLSDVDALELDVRRDLVMGLEGTLSDTAVGRRLAGRDAVRLTAELDVTTLSSKCSELLALSRETTYKENFPWFGVIEEVRDPTEVEQVEKRAFEALGQRAFSKFDLYPCDLLSSNRHLIHVKPRKGGSAPLSHLFAQAVVSAECLTGEPAFRQKFRAVLKRSAPAFEHLFDEPIRTGEFSVVLGLITDTAGNGRPAIELPFFSKLTLKLAVQRLRSMGFKVYVDEIRRELSVSPKPPEPRDRRAPVTALAKSASSN